MKTPTITVRTVTPEMATKMLANRFLEQRSVRQNHVCRMAKDMVDGRWTLGPDAIVLTDGKCTNGQHRLMAVIMSKRPQPFLIMENSEPGLYRCIDSGLRRTASDALSSLEHSTDLPPMARWVLAYDWRTGPAADRATGFSGPARSWGSQGLVIEYCEEHAEIMCEAAKFVRPLYEVSALIPKSIGGALYVIASRIGEVDAARAFLNALYSTGGHHAAGDLRNRMIHNKGSRTRLHIDHVFTLTLKAFCAYQEGRRMKIFRFLRSEPFPQVKASEREFA